eukprot:TRINITY_DN4211_c0_g1_i1.p1 TRINITY_DN4211_c0_g1~~TRINITY_DN4211_c0_g1_i1.p1  ORF type:complete len:352 (-),score=104.67 TRINITY_DN4211_c0_g1_i1:27-1082(-)
MTTPLHENSVQALESIAQRCKGCHTLLLRHEWKVSEEKSFDEYRQLLIRFGQAVRAEATKLSLVLRGDSSPEGVKSLAAKVNEILFNMTMTAASFGASVANVYRKKIVEKVIIILEKFTDLAMAYTVRQNRYEVALTLTSVVWSACDDLQQLPRTQIECLSSLLNSTSNALRDAVTEISSALEQKLCSNQSPDSLTDSVAAKMESLDMDNADDAKDDMDDFDFFDDVEEFTQDDIAQVRVGLKLMADIDPLIVALNTQIVQITKTMTPAKDEREWTARIDEFAAITDKVAKVAVDLGAAMAMDRDELPELIRSLQKCCGSLIRKLPNIPHLCTPQIQTIADALLAQIGPIR